MPENLSGDAWSVWQAQCWPWALCLVGYIQGDFYLFPFKGEKRCFKNTEGKQNIFQIKCFFPGKLIMKALSFIFLSLKRYIESNTVIGLRPLWRHSVCQLNTEALASNRPGFRPMEQSGAGRCISKPQFPHLWDGDDWCRLSFEKTQISCAPVETYDSGSLSAVDFWELQNVLGGEEKPTCNQEVFLCRYFC